MMTDREAWVRLAAAGLMGELARGWSDSSARDRATRHADELLKQYHERFPQEGPYR